MGKVLTILMLCLLIGLSFGQTRRLVLLEEATNASCGPCAANNPKLQAFYSKHFGGVISVRYHAWWPGQDPMYQLNIPDNTNRIQYYGINGVPNYLIDGVNHGVPGDPQAMASQMFADLAQEAPVKIKVTAQYGMDSVKTQIQLIGVAPVAQTQLKLRAAIIERLVEYTTPPGSNGEKEFQDVMRKMLPDGDGIAVTAINPGDTLNFSFAVETNSQWDYQDLAVVAWLQSDANKEVIQAGTDLPTYIVEAEGSMSEVIDFNQVYERRLFITNDNPQAIQVRIKPEEIHVPAAWNYQLLYNGAAIDSVDLTIAPGDTEFFSIKFQTDNTPDMIKVGVFAKNLNDPYGYGASATYTGVIFNGNVLIVDDDGGNNFEVFYQSALDSIGVDYTTMAESDVLALQNSITPNQFKAIFWDLGWAFPTLTDDDFNFLKTYLDNGGHLFIAGQDLGWDVFENGGSSLAVNFYNTYLGADYKNDNSSGTQVEGVAGDPITDGISSAINNVYQKYPEWIEPFQNLSTPILTYNVAGKHGGLRYDNGTFKTVYLGIAAEQFADVQAALTIIQRTAAWFDVVTDIKPENPATPYSFELAQNYPNPFNPETRISFSLPQSEQVTLAIYNTLGQKVAELVNGQMTAGWHEVSWDARNANGQKVASGVYIYRLKTREGVIQKKMLLVR